MNAILILELDDDATNGVEIEDGKRYVLGRGRDADIILDDPGLSRAHAVLIQDDTGAWTIRDNGSSNGTYLNGQRVEQALLRPNDLLAVGQSRLRFRAAPEPAGKDTGGGAAAASTRGKPVLLVTPDDEGEAPAVAAQAAGGLQPP
ncbi:MAG: FHA domain-containing protein, partial [Lentisphaeria bacterium]|nr:FHA domain-containing protein [Lentisphaeria bacterium]